MMGRMMKYLRSFPRIVFQPINHAINRRTTKRKSGDSSPPTLHLPPISRSKSMGLPSNNSQNNNQPMIRIRRARSIKPDERKGSLNLLFSSETNLTTFPESKHGVLTKDKSASFANNLHIPNNNSITLKNQYNSKDGLPKNRKSFWKGSENKGKVKASELKSEIPRIVAEVISESCSGRIRLERQMIRLINGADPSVQSQVLLNTKTSQPWETLVRELGMAVRLPHCRKIGNRLETLYGRQVGILEYKILTHIYFLSTSCLAISLRFHEELHAIYVISKERLTGFYFS